MCWQVPDLLVDHFQGAFKVGKAEDSLELEDGGLLRPERELAVRHLCHEARVGHRRHLRHLALVAAVDQEQEVQDDANEEAGVNVQEDDRREREDPEQPVPLGVLVELGQVVHLQQHALESHDKDGAKYCLKTDLE